MSRQSTPQWARQVYSGWDGFFRLRNHDIKDQTWKLTSFQIHIKPEHANESHLWLLVEIKGAIACSKEVWVQNQESVQLKTLKSWRIVLPKYLELHWSWVTSSPTTSSTAKFQSGSKTWFRNWLAMFEGKPTKTVSSFVCLFDSCYPIRRIAELITRVLIEAIVFRHFVKCVQVNLQTFRSLLSTC